MEGMHSLKLRRMMESTLWLRLVLSIWLVIGGMEGAVLCFELDGRLQIEFLQAPSCCRALVKTGSFLLETPGGALSAVPIFGDNCGPCTDITLSIDDALHRSAPQPSILVLQQPLLPADPAATVAATCGERPEGSRLSDQRSTPFSRTLAGLSSVVLLI
jgi:hypothetical protein